MYSRLSSVLRQRAGARDEQGVVAVIVAVTMTALLVVVGLVLDFGLVRADRQVDKSAADSATLAGLHALASASDGTMYPAVGVCTAIRYLRANSPRFTSVSSSTGSWTNGTGATIANGCTDTTLQSTACIPGNMATWVKYRWSGTFQGTALEVTVQSGYQLSSSTGWSEDTLPAAQTFQDDAAQGCQQLAAVITQHRKPGFGSLATSKDLVSSIRSVGRVKVSPGGNAPAMLLLKRTGCPVVQTGSAGGGSHVWVSGAISSDGRSQPGTIHADTDGSGCTGGSNQNIFLGRAGAGIVAFAAPLVSNPSAPDPSKPGLVTTYAAMLGKSDAVLRDSPANACGSTTLSTLTPTPCPANGISGMSRITRALIDKRYLDTVRTAMSNAAGVFSSVTSTSPGWKVATCNGSGTVTLPSPLTSSDSLYVNCVTPKSMPTVVAKTIVFSGVPTPSGIWSMPNATKVYVFGSASDGMKLGSGTFSMHTNGNLSGGKCSNATRPSTDKAVLFVKNGVINASNNSLLQLCNTTVFMLGGQANGCLPASNGTPPTQTPCASGTSMGTGQLKQNGGDTDWTAPNSVDVTLDANGNPTASALAGWTDPNGPEDLAFWSESAGNMSSTTFQMSGQSSLHTVGVYMAPNADAFQIGGGSCQQLTNAQYIATSLALNGTGACLNMKVDSYAAVQLPQTTLVGLVR